MASPTLRELTGMNPNPSPISESALVLIDCQQTYREGIMQLVGVEPALKEAVSLLKRFRAAGRPVIHIMHDAGPGTPYDVSAPIGQIADIVAPIEGETVVVKNKPGCVRKDRARCRAEEARGEERDLCRLHDAYVRELDHARVVQSWLRQYRGCGGDGDAVRYPTLRPARTSRLNRFRTRACRRSATCSP
jgi:hypothetical protein